jgi:hypothetical protein
VGVTAAAPRIELGFRVVWEDLLPAIAEDGGGGR